MSVLTDAKLILTPNAYKASKLYSLKPFDGTGDFDVVRATTAWRRDESGVWVEEAANVPRLHYPVGGGCPSVLVEPQRTNFLNNARIDTWINGAGTTTPTTMLGLGANTVENNSGAISTPATGTIRVIGNQVSLSVVSGDVVTYSFYARKENSNGNVVEFWLFGATPNTVRFQPRFNFETNTLITLQTPTNITNTNIRSTNVGNDIYLIEATFQATASTMLVVNNITPRNIDAITTFGHPQVELGASASSPIVSTGTILTRNADVIDVTTPAGVTEIVETFSDGSTNTETAIPATYQLPNGEIKSIVMT
jgi:hypothetical protein